MAERDGDRVVLVTGASGAIGFEIAAQAAEQGAIVAVHGSSDASVARAMAKLRDRVREGRFLATPADFRADGAIERMVASVADQGGRIDAVIHCGIVGALGVTGPFAKADATQFANHAALVIGAFQRLCAAALSHFDHNGGAIIGFASDAARFAAPRQAIIGGAFGGIVAFVRNLAPEIARANVRIHCITPGFVAETPIYQAHAARAQAAQERAGLGLPTPADIAPMALFLCGEGARKMTGQIISINGGLNA